MKQCRCSFNSSMCGFVYIVQCNALTVSAISVSLCVKYTRTHIPTAYRDIECTFRLPKFDAAQHVQ